MARKKLPPINERVTIDKLIETVRRLADEHPENVYRPASVAHCSYVKGKCTPSRKHGCLFGQALRLCGVTKEELDSFEVNGGGGIEMLLDKFGIAYESNRVKWCSTVQGAQDSGRSWRDAVRRADERYPLEREL